MNNTQSNLINNNKYDDVHFLLNMKHALERQNSYICSLIEEINDYNNDYNNVYNNDYKQFLQVKESDVFSLKLKEQQLTNETIINDINMKMLQLCKHEIEEDYIEMGVENSMLKIRFCINCQLNM